MVPGMKEISGQAPAAVAPVKMPGKGAGGVALAIIGLAALAGVAVALKPGRDEAEEQAKEEKADENKTPAQKSADDERRRLMAEIGRKGAQKSAEVRRAKKKEREAKAAGSGGDDPAVSA